MTISERIKADKRSRLLGMGNGCVRVVDGCIVARMGDYFYSGGDTVDLIYNTPRTVESMLEFIDAHDEHGKYCGTHGRD